MAQVRGLGPMFVGIGYSAARLVCAPEKSPDISMFMPEGFDLSTLKVHQADVVSLYVTEGPRDSKETRQANQDAWWRAMVKQGLGQALAGKMLHIHHDSIPLNGRVGEGAGNRFSIGRCTLRPGVKLVDVLGPVGSKSFTFAFTPPNAVCPQQISVVLCERSKIVETPFFKTKNWREEEYDGAQRNLGYVTVAWGINNLEIVETKLKPILTGMFLSALAKADPVKNASGKVVLEQMRLLYDADGNHTQVLFGVAAADGFGNLPAQCKLVTGATESDKMCTAVSELSWAVMGDKHRCYRGGTCIITNEHEGSAACAAKNNDAGRNRWAPRRGPRAGGGGGSDLRRAAARAPLQLPPGSSAPPPMLPDLLHRGLHERVGEVRNGHSLQPALGKGKRSAEGESSQQVPPALRGGEPMQQ